MKSLSLIANSFCNSKLRLYAFCFVKHCLLLLTVLSLTISCQQQIPEIAYDLDATSITDQTRHLESERLVLFQDKIGFVNEGPIKTFVGQVLDINLSPKNSLLLQLKNDAGQEILIEMDAHIKKEISKNMRLIVRYTIVKDNIHLMEVRKEE